MTSTYYLPEEELIQTAMKALLNALGPVEALRFLNLPRPLRLESVERHRQWQDSLDEEQFLAQVFSPNPSA
ncbi:MAG: hypothetical protein BWK78_09055 [Thiotrichaceae bacterium IS1]|nr:MAG: hypothetical protein BWK78_09055 [Thiotrichaceae bacterium IS1]